ncbi:MAG: hypothetical protein AAB214_07970 [Fibrobacterota bacterium]
MIHAFLVLLFAASPSSFDPNAGRFPLPVFQAHMPADEAAAPGGRWGSAGALAFDRSFAVPRRLSLSPWVPRPGLNGAMLSMEL